MIAATSCVVSISIFLRKNSTQCHSHDGNVLSNTQRAHAAYGLRYVPGMSGPSACLKFEPSTGSTPPVVPVKLAPEPDDPGMAGGGFAGGPGRLTPPAPLGHRRGRLTSPG